MSRWHKPHCNAPDVSVSGETPQCITCDTRCPLEELISAQKSNPPLSLPANEPCGELNLWWPQSVPYGISKAREHSVQSMAQNNQTSNFQNKLADGNVQLLERDQSPSKNPGLEEQVDPKELLESVHLPIYGPTLGADEFRLVCISAAEKDEEKIIHVSLETYDQKSCPEYETVSYTWGGENGDYALCRPVFVGPYWDVVFQTQNCWDMLQFVRPWRGIRMVWVDALCINQGNVKEREAQVAKMGQIYEHCSRVVVYLGADLVSSTRGRFPSRHLLHEIESDSINPQLPNDSQLENTRINLREILNRNYFSRVWVIQELLLSQRAIIRIGDLDFCSDSTGLTHFQAAESTTWEWDSTAAPWVQYMAQKSFPSSKMYELLRITSQSRASDPRDRLFGILGLIQYDGLENQIWKPEYSLTAQHISIGLIAHFIINLKMFHLFRYAAGLSAPASSPSWMPDWVAPESWQRIFKIPGSDVDEMANFISKNVLLDPGYDLRRIEGYTNTTDIFPYDDYWDGRNQLNGWECFQDWADAIFEKKQWNCGIFVDTNTGALFINMIHLSTISFRPAMIEKCGTLGIFEVKGSKTSLYLAAECPLEFLSSPGADHLFMLVSKGSDDTYFILRELDGTGRYKLIASCVNLFIAERNEKTFKVDSLYNEIERARSWLDRDLSKWFNNSSINEMKRFFPGITKFRDFMPAYRCIFNEQNESNSDFEISYLSCIDQEFQPRIVDGFLELSFSSREPYELWSGYMDFGTRTQENILVYNSDGDRVSNCGYPGYKVFKNPWEWRRWRKWTPLSLELLPKAPFLSRLYVRAPMSVVREISEFILTPIKRIQHNLGIGLDEVEALLRDGPKEEQRFIGSVSSNIACEFNLDIFVRQVQIL